MSEEEREYREYLMETYPFEDRFRNLLKQIQDLLAALGLLDQVRVDTRVLGQVLINYFEDIDRVKGFEKMKRVNVDKIYAYESFWLLRGKPLQIITQDIDMKFLHINEKIVTALLFIKMMKEMGISYDMENPRLATFMELVYYNFKYRVYTQQSLESMVSGFFCGCAFCRVKGEERS